MRFQLPALPFNVNALADFLSAEAIDLHYNGHHRTYVQKVNDIVDATDFNLGSLERIIHNHDGDLYNNAAQAWNHTFFWHGLCESGHSEMPEDGGDFDQAIERSFGGLAPMQQAYAKCAATLFGSGYVWLTVNGQKNMEFMISQNAENPLRFDRVRPLWTCDLWEHAFYVDYRNGRAKYVEKSWDFINWDFVEKNFLHGEAPNMSKFMISSAKMEAAIGQHSAPVFD